MIIKLYNKIDIDRLSDYLQINDISYYCFEENNVFYYRLVNYNNRDNIINLGINNIDIIDNDRYYFVTKDFKENTSFKINDLNISNNCFFIIGGPCSLESKEQFDKIYDYIKDSKTDMIRIGLFKPRTSPITFQGLQDAGIAIVDNIRNEIDKAIVCELTSIEQVKKYADMFDVIQIGARNMQNFELLKAVSKTNKAIILKRGFSNTIDELLYAAEYIYLNGNNQIILCERGIRTFEKAYRNTLDLNAVALLKEITHLPIIVDPSHGTGKASLVNKLAYASIMVDCNGLLIETHYNPSIALSDKNQALNKDEYLKLVENSYKIYHFNNKLKEDDKNEI